MIERKESRQVCSNIENGECADKARCPHKENERTKSICRMSAFDAVDRSSILWKETLYV